MWGFHETSEGTRARIPPCALNPLTSKNPHRRPIPAVYAHAATGLLTRSAATASGLSALVGIEMPSRKGTVLPLLSRNYQLSSPSDTSSSFSCGSSSLTEPLIASIVLTCRRAKETFSSRCGWDAEEADAHRAPSTRIQDKLAVGVEVQNLGRVKLNDDVVALAPRNRRHVSG